MLLVVCKLAKIWFIMQCTLSQLNAVSTFSYKKFFSYDPFSAKSRVCFCSIVATVAGIERFSLLCSFVSFHLLINRSYSFDPYFGEKIIVDVLFYLHRLASVRRAGSCRLVIEHLLQHWSLHNLQTSKSRKSLGCFYCLCFTRTGSWAMVLEMILKNKHINFSNVCVWY